MKKIFVMLAAFVLMLSFGSTAFATGWGPEIEPNKEYVVDITKYELVVEGGKSKLVENNSVVAKKGDTVYFSISVYNKECKNEELMLVFENGEFCIADFKDVNIAVSGLKNLAVYDENRGILKGIVCTETLSLTVSIQSILTIDKLIANSTVTPYGSFIKIGNIVFERDADYYVIGAYQYDESLEGYLAAGDFVPVRRVKATEAQLAAFGMTVANVEAGVYLVDANNIVANLGTTCLAEKTVSWGAVVSSSVLELPQTGDAPTYIGFAMLGAALVMGMAIVWKKFCKGS